MRMPFNLSFRYKIPLWGSFLIVATATIISCTLLFRAYDDLKSDLLHDAEAQGRTLAKTLFAVILQDHVQQAYEILNAPLSGPSEGNMVQVESLLVLDARQRVYVSTRPESLPMLADFGGLSPGFANVAKSIAGMGNETGVFEPDDSEYLFVATPIIEEEARLGTVVQIYPKNALLPRFFDSAGQAALMGGLILAILLPINWYWGRRTANPLVRLTERMEELGRGQPPDGISPELYGYDDELGRLFGAYNRTVQQLREKALIEQEVVRSERLVAIGRLAAGIAHEINNPLLGMLTSINTLRRHGEPDARTLKTLMLLERGLTQIRETVAALLVDAQVKSRNFSPQDMDDVRTLITPQAHKRSVDVRWTTGLGGTLPLPSTLVRQVLINLILNAVQAADEGGEVDVIVAVTADVMAMEIVNSGRILSETQRVHLFEPFINAGETGRGLGLWVCYQIVHQLGGNIDVTSGMIGGRGQTRFAVSLPLEYLDERQ